MEGNLNPMGIDLRQLNAGKRGDCWNDIRNIVSCGNKPKVILLQEPPKQANLPFGRIFKANCPKGKEKKIRACIYVDKDFAHSTSCHPLTEFTDSDQVAISLNVEIDKNIKTKLVLCSIYFPSDVKREHMITEKLVKLVEFCNTSNTELVIGCDSNAHNQIWHSIWLHIHNRGEDATFKPKPTADGKEKSSIIDLTLSTEKIGRIITNWRVLLTDSYSDHR